MRGCLHKECSQHLLVIPTYPSSLQRFADMLTDQVDVPGSTTTSPGRVGVNLAPKLLNRLRDEQIGQLYKLKLETTSYGRPLQMGDKNRLS